MFVLQICLIFCYFLFSGHGHPTCPKFEPMENLNLNEFSGSWKIHGILVEGEVFPLPSRCSHYNMTSRDWTSEPVLINIVRHPNINNITTTSEYFAEVPTLSNVGKLIYKDVNCAARYEETVLHTNYEEYGLSGYCSYVASTEYTAFFFLSRYFQPMPQDVIDEYFNLARTKYITDGIPTYLSIEQSEELCVADHASN